MKSAALTISLQAHGRRLNRRLSPFLIEMNLCKTRRVAIAPAWIFGSLAAGALLLPCQAPAQIPTAIPPDTQLGVQSVESRPPAYERTLLEGAIDRTRYVLGPGDILTLSLIGFRSHVFTIEVAPEGTIVIPEVGVVDVKGLNLEQAERAAASAIRRYYTDTDVNLTLRALRSFKVYLVGSVEDPGSRSATAVTRVSELVEPFSEGVLRRNVVLRRSDSSFDEVDLARFVRTGDLKENPTVREGDLIHVAPVDRTVSVSGRVAFPGRYEFRESETVAQLLKLANGDGPFPADAADTIRLQRFTNDAVGEVRVLSRIDALGQVGQNIELEPFDALFVPRIAHYKEATTATVAGEVAFPGTYPIEPDVTTVGDLVEMAGGLTAKASLFDALLRRSPTRIAGGAETQLQTIPPDMLSREELQILQVTSRGDDDVVVVDLKRVLDRESRAHDIPLEDNDRLYIPELREEVVVIGAVMTPGIVTYQPGQPIDYYVNLAGGYSRRADKGDVSVLKGSRGIRLSRRDALTLEPGDRIVVPFKEPKTFLERVQTTQGIATTISGLVLTLVALTRLWN